MALNRPAEALQSIEASLDLGGFQADLLNAKGMLLVRLGEKGGGIAAFRAAYAAEPKRAEIAHNLSLALYDFGALEEAFAFAERAYLNEPGDPTFRLNMARCLAALGRLDEAKAAARAILALSPQDIGAVDLLSSLMIVTGEDDKGLAICANLVRQSNQSGEACLILAQNLRRAGRFDQALGALAQAKLDAATAPAALLLETEILFCLGQYDKAFDARTIDIGDMRTLTTAGTSLNEAILCARWLVSDASLYVPETLAPLFSAFDSAKVATQAPSEAASILSLMTRERCSQGAQSGAYLRPSTECVKPWADALHKLPGPRIGVLWDRAAPGLTLADLMPALEDAGTLIGLAVDPLRHDLQNFPQIRDGGVNIDTPLQLAAAIAAVDFIVATDSTVAHLAGALGKPGIVLVAAGYPWYWWAEQGHSVWYPSLEVMTQPRPGSWAEVTHALKARLSQLASVWTESVETVPEKTPIASCLS
jgi:tetratricopeptide (TPR) repeat protein